MRKSRKAGANVAMERHCTSNFLNAPNALPYLANSFSSLRNELLYNVLCFDNAGVGH